MPVYPGAPECVPEPASVEDDRLGGWPNRELSDWITTENGPPQRRAVRSYSVLCCLLLPRSAGGSVQTLRFRLGCAAIGANTRWPATLIGSPKVMLGPASKVPRRRANAMQRRDNNP